MLRSLDWSLPALAAAALVLALPTSALPQVKPADWSYDTVAEPVNRPAWTERVVIIDSFQNNPFAGSDWNELTPWAKRLQDAGFTILTYCPLDKVASARATGARIVHGMRPFIAENWMEEAIRSHPEWLLQSAPGVPYSKDSACLISPFGDAVADILARNVKQYQLDAYTFDGWYQARYCCCDYCAKNYKQDTGRDIPPKMDSTDLNYRRYLVWRDAKLMQRALQLSKAVKAANPEALIINWSNNDANGAYPSWMPESLNCVFDMTWKEWWDAYDVYSIWLNKRMRGSAGDRAPSMQPYTFMRWGKDIASGVYHGSSTPMSEVLYRMHEALAMGAIPIIWSGARTGFQPSDWDKVIQDWIDYLPFVHEARTLKYAACIDSYTTLQMSGISSEGEFHGPMQKMINEKVAFHRGGVARALLESHIPFDVISEHNVTSETLSQYRVIVLPNNFCMSERIAAVLRDYVSKGGGLVATFETSLYDQWGERRPDFALADVFGASYLSSEGPSAGRVNFARTAHPITDDSYLRDLMGTAGYNTYYGSLARVKAAQTCSAPLTCLDVANEKDESRRNWTPLLASSFGKGRVAYFPAAIDAAYYDAGYPYQRLLIANAATWAAGAAPQVSVTAPMCIFAGFFTRNTASAKQTIVHVLNGLNTTTGHGSPAEKEFAFREEVVPVRNAKVIFRGGRPTAVRLVPENVALPPKRVKGGWEVAVPEVALHSVVVAEYAGR